MVIPAQARKQARIDTGDVLNIQVEGDGRLSTVRLTQPKEKLPAKVRILQRKGKHPVGDIGRPITRSEIRAVLAELASSKGMKLATFDTHIKHAAVQVIK
jgi:bifunctional DNA-binding transcriptional regulator/antitoxin component of YhaV-PrlF toxin-antitoxin module